MVLNAFFFKFLFFFVQPAPVQHPYLGEIETIFAGNRMHGEIALDGNKIWPIYPFTNIVNDRDPKDAYGQRTANRVLKEHKDFLEKFGIYKMRSARGSDTPAMTFFGLKAFLSKLPGNASDKYMVYCIEMTSRIEAGDSKMKQVIDANAASSNMLNQMARDAVAQERASGGASIAAPPEQVLERACLLLMYLR